jgi:hypothetical protein
MCYRTREFGLGATYRDGDDADLARAFAGLEVAGPDAYAPRLRAFIECFSRAQVAAAVRAAVTGAGPIARLPQDEYAARLQGARRGPS